MINETAYDHIKKALFSLYLCGLVTSVTHIFNSVHKGKPDPI